METTVNKTTATLLQLSAYTQYFFPFGNFIFPVLIWSVKKNESEFVDYNGKQVINFQLSLLVYTILLAIIAVPLLIYTFFNGLNLNFAYNRNWIIENDGDWVLENFDFQKISGLLAIAILVVVLFVTMKVVEFFLILYAAVKNTNGENFNYPLTIKFIK
jgi:uncharacterized Tic20 family protein